MPESKFVESIRKIDRYKFTPIIFTTALEDANLYAYAQLHCYRYFEKPYDNDEFLETVKETLKFQTEKKENRYYKYKKDFVHYIIKVEDIVYFEIDHNTSHIHCKDEVVDAPYKSTKNTLLELNSERFLKCNKNTIVNADYVESVDIVNRYAYLRDGYGKLEIGIRLKQSFLEGLQRCSK